MNPFKAPPTARGTRKDSEVKFRGSEEATERA
jgi:hypothetical protein